MGHFEPVPGLDRIIAEKIAAPRIRRILDMLADEARRRAPDGKVWVTMRDERVRDSHFEADTQVVPVNLRFLLPTPTGHDLARHPRDPNLPAGQRINCRCDDPTLPDVIRDTIVQGDLTIVGNRVSGDVYTRFPRAAESNYAGPPDEPTHFMDGALYEVAARLRNAHAR